MQESTSRDSNPPLHFGTGVHPRVGPAAKLGSRKNLLNAKRKSRIGKPAHSLKINKVFENQCFRIDRIETNTADLIQESSGR